MWCQLISTNHSKFQNSIFISNDAEFIYIKCYNLIYQQRRWLMSSDFLSKYLMSSSIIFSKYTDINILKHPNQFPSIYFESREITHKNYRIQIHFLPFLV